MKIVETKLLSRIRADLQKDLIRVDVDDLATRKELQEEIDGLEILKQELDEYRLIKTLLKK